MKRAVNRPGASHALVAHPVGGFEKALAQTHAQRLVDWNGEQSGMRSFRKHGGWYLTGYPVGGTARKAVNVVATLAELDDVLAQLDPTVEIRDNALRAARGHTQGPRAVHLPEGWLDLVDDPTPPEGAEDLVSGG